MGAILTLPLLDPCAGAWAVLNVSTSGTYNRIMPLTPKQDRFVELYLIDLNATGAYRSAYGVNDKAAASGGCRLLSRPAIAEAIRVAQAARSQRTAINQDYVLNRLRENVERCM